MLGHAVVVANEKRREACNPRAHRLRTVRGQCICNIGGKTGLQLKEMDDGLEDERRLPGALWHTYRRTCKS
jgi:hypothetical protein